MLLGSRGSRDERREKKVTDSRISKATGALYIPLLLLLLVKSWDCHARRRLSEAEKSLLVVIIDRVFAISFGDKFPL
jgi:hypothetical protein